MHKSVNSLLCMGTLNSRVGRKVNKIFLLRIIDSS
jgi:hypothetical protein